VTQFSLILKEHVKMFSVTALKGRASTGFIEVADAGLMGMITLRGDLSSAQVAKAVKAATGTKMPAQRQCVTGAKGACAWMSPDELLLMVDYERADATVAKVEKALSGEHNLVANVSDARAVFDLSGDAIRDVLAKGSPADMSVDALPIGEVRRTRIAQLAVAFWFTDDNTARLVCFRSVAGYVMDWLENASENGTEVGFH
jgi:sarcosine oxidase subunit gamma